MFEHTSSSFSLSSSWDIEWLDDYSATVPTRRLYFDFWVLVDARNCTSNDQFQAPNKLLGCQTLIEHKTMASLGMTVEDRQSKINTDIKKHAQELDRQNPGSTFEAELKAYGENGKYLALVTGPFANLSSDFNALVDLIARERARCLISQ
jgi:hypothetical protein